jgi:hypothetical protein
MIYKNHSGKYKLYRSIHNWKVSDTGKIISYVIEDAAERMQLIEDLLSFQVWLHQKENLKLQILIRS